MKFSVLFFFICFGVLTCKGTLPSIQSLKEEIARYEMFSDIDVNTICCIQTNSCGLWYWETCFSSVYNSELPEEDQNRPLALLLALGTLQIDPNDMQLIEDLRSEMSKWTKSEKDAINRENVGFTFQDLESEFNKRSASSSPVGSSDSEE